MTEREVCNCNWVDCAWISEQIALHAPDKHAWRGSWHSWRQRVNSPSTMCEKMLFLASSCHHVDGIEDFLQSGGKSSKNGERGIKKELKLAPHHYPTAIYEYMEIMKFKKVPTLLTATQMGIVAKLDKQKQRLLEEVNQVKKMDVLLKEKILPPGGLLKSYVDNALTKLEGKLDHFVCAPVVTREEALMEVKSWSRKRKQRVPVPVVPKLSKTARLLPGATLHTKKMAELIRAAEAATLRKVAEKAAIATAAAAIAVKRQGAEDVLLEVAKESAELKAVAEAKNIPVPVEIHSPDLVASVSSLSDKIKAKIKDMGIERATCEGKCIRYIQMLRKYHSYFNPIPILDDDFLYPCKNVHGQNKDCIKFRISRRDRKDGMICEDCAKKENLKKNQQRRMNRPELSECEKRRVESLAPPLMLRLVDAQRRLIASLKQRNARLVGRLLRQQEREEQIPALKDGDAYDLIREAFKHAEENKEEFIATIVKALMELNRDLGDFDSAQKQMQEFAEFVSREITNKSKQLAGEKKQVRYSPTTINLAMNVYLQSRKSYEDLRKRSLTALPCIRYLQKMKSSFRSMEGDNPGCYMPLLDAKLLSFPAGHLCVDEVTIKSDLVWNVKNNEITGFCNVGTSSKTLKDQLKRILANEDDDDSDYQPVMANQWRFRSVFNEHYTSEFFFNNGSLDSDEMMRQLLQVLTNYESIGVAIHGVCCDGGGANEGLFGMFRENKSINDRQIILGKDDVAMVNPYDPTRVVWFWNCQVHNLKNCRNALWRSFAPDCRRRGGSLGKGLSRRNKCLMRFLDKAPFGWQGMLDSYARQRERVTTNKAGNMHLSFQAVNLDGLTLMNVPLAKAAFSREVLAEISDHCRNELMEELAQNELDPERDEVKGYDVEGGRGTGVRFLHYASVFRQAIPTNAESKLKYKQILSDICLLEYLSVMHTIFIERFVNKEWSITLENIDSEIAAIQAAISMLVAWQEEKQQFQANLPKGAPKTSWQRHLMAWKTFRNLRVGVSGFFGYVRDILNRYGEKVFFVPALHSNQSMIESYFGKMRAHGHDYTSKVHVAASASNALSVINSRGSIVDVETGAKMRDTQYNSWRTKRLDFPAEDTPLLRPTASLQPKTTLGKMVLDRLNGMAIGGFANFLQATTLLADHAKLSIGTNQEEFFECIVQQKCEAEFDRRCQSAIEWCWLTLDESLDAPNNSPRRLYFFNLHAKLVALNKETDKELGEEHPLNNNIGWSTIHLVLSKFVLGQVALVFDSLRHKLRPTSVSEDTVDCLKTVRTDINKFCGWLLFSIRTLMMNGKWSQQFDDEDRDTLIRLLHDMSTRERDIATNKQYIEDYYPFVERIINEGGLTLWSPKYIDLGFSLLASITDQLSFDELRSKGNGYAKAVRLEVIKAVEKEMLPKFLELSSNITDDRELRKRLFFQIVDKTFHCRTSAFLKFYSSENRERGTKGEKSAGIRDTLKIQAGTNAAKRVEIITL